MTLCSSKNSYQLVGLRVRSYKARLFSVQSLQEVLELVIEAAGGLSLGRLGGHLALLQQEHQHRVQGVPGKKFRTE